MAPSSKYLHPIAIAFAFFVLCLFISSIMVDIVSIRSDTVDIYRQTFMLLVGMSPFLLAYRVTRRQDIGNTATTWLAHAVMVICTASIGLEATGLTSFESYGDRRVGFIGDSVALMITFPVLVYGASGRRPLLALSLILLFLTGSRGPFLFAFVGLLAIAAFGRRKTRAEAFILISLLLITGLLMSNYVTDLAQRFDAFEADDGRIVTPQAGMKLFANSPLFGHGYAALSYYYPLYDDVDAAIYGRYRDGVFPVASSTWVQMLADGGLLLSIPYFALIGLTARHCLPRIGGWLSQQRTKSIAGASLWLVIIFYLNHSSGWFLAGAGILPLIMALLGIVTGTMVYELRQAILQRGQMRAQHSQ
jgi:O-antigen ligase